MSAAPELVDLRTLDDDARRAVYRALIAPGFPPDELVPEDDLVAETGPAGGAGGWVARVEGRDVGVAQVGGSAGGRAVLLSYLAVDPGVRSAGLGRALLERTVATTDGLLLAEVEDPAHHTDRGFGDPRRRVRFYAALGGRRLDVPYFQPRLTPGGNRVPHLFLVLLSDAPGDTVQALPVRLLLEDYLRAGGDTADDPDARALLDAVAGERVRLLPLPTED